VRELTCIVCPLGCRLQATEEPSGEIKTTGNRCPRGAVYAEEEIRAPKRVVTATCRLSAEGSGSIRRVPVRGTVPCPREYVDELLADIYGLRVSAPVTRGAALIVDWKGRGIDVVATRTVE
jgi:CxxC motif-containing protein